MEIQIGESLYIDNLIHSNDNDDYNACGNENANYMVRKLEKYYLK